MRHLTTRSYIQQGLALLILFFSLFSQAYASKPLQADEAFKLSVSYVRPGVIMAVWHIAPGYYLYADKMKVDFRPPLNGPVDLRFPKAEVRNDEEHGRYEVYSGIVSVPIHLAEGQPLSTLSIDYQGCSANGFCYPPMNNTFMVNTAESKVMKMGDMQASTKATPTFASLLTDQNGVDTLLQNQGIGVLLLIFVGLGLLLAFTPCVLPMVPILTSIIVGQKHAPHSRQAFFLSAIYVLGMALTYALAGVAVASLGGSIQVWLQKPVTIILVSSIFIFLALSLFGLYELRFSRRWQNKIHNWSNKHEGGTYVGVFFMGVLSTLVVSPCITAPLVGVLIYIGQTGNAVLGASALFAMGIGMGIPLLVIGMSAGKWLPKSGPWMQAIKELFGIFMVAMAIWLLSRILNPAVTMILFGLLFLGTAAFIGLHLPRSIRMHKINRAIGFGFLMLSLFFVYGGINQFLSVQPVQTAENKGSFKVVHNMEELKNYMTMAQEANQPVLLDFYADWCASCVQMDKKVFSREDVHAALGSFMLLRADLSKNTAEDSEILKHFNVIAPPTVLFFNNAGQEVDSRRIVGELNQKEFLSRIQSFITASCDKNIQC